ncbi:MAG: class I SAM-dependent methyltransferase [Candidatus Magasanikbacteria bacterium]|nr:class I SAM-dependent methyltransferase [Candidatus Magasanikbacteria bacterium]
MKQFLVRLKNDVSQIFGYPICAYGQDFSVDYQKYWERRRDSGTAVLTAWQKQRAAEALKIITPGATVMDIGCGDGAILDFMRSASRIKGIGVDIDSSILESAKKLGVQTVCADINDLSAVDAFPAADYIIAFEVLEHMPSPERFIAHILKKATQGLIFSVPNTGYYAHRLRLASGRFPLQWVAHPGEHLRFWTVRDMRFWVASLGLKIEKLVLYQGLPVLNKIFPKLFSQGMIVFIKK